MAKLHFVCTSKQERLRNDNTTDWYVVLAPKPTMEDGRAQYAPNEGGIELRVFDERLIDLFKVGQSYDVDFNFTLG